LGEIVRRLQLKLPRILAGNRQWHGQVKSGERNARNQGNRQETTFAGFSAIGESERTKAGSNEHAGWRCEQRADFFESVVPHRS
jgi:hypothetical protein